MVEAIARVPRLTSARAMDQLLPRQRAQVLGYRDAQRLGGQRVTAGCSNCSPITDAGSIIARSARAELAEPRLEQRMDGRRHVDVGAASARTQRPSSSAARRGRPASTATARRTAGCLRRCRRCAPAHPAASRRCRASWHHLGGGSVAQRAQHDAQRPRLLAPLRALLQQSWRAVHSSRIGAPSQVDSRCSSRSRNAVSAQWMSSTSATTGPRGGQRSRRTCARPSRSRAAGRCRH